MQNLRQLCATAMVMLGLAVATFADGQVNCPPIASPPPPTATTTGNIECGGLQLAVGVMTSVLSLT